MSVRDRLFWEEQSRFLLLDKVMERCLEAVDFVGHANYHERIVEARKQVRDAFCDLKNETKEHSV